MRICRTELSILFIVIAFFFMFLGSLVNFPFGSYFATLFSILSLYLCTNKTPFIFIIILSFSIIFFLLSPSPYFLAAIVPLIGLLFSGGNKNYIQYKTLHRYAILVALCFFYVIYFLSAKGIFIFHPIGSHNILTAMVVYALITEMLYFGKPSRYYIPLLFFSFLFFGNRSALYLLAVFIKSRIVLLFFLIVGLVFTIVTYGLIDPPKIILPLFETDGLMFRHQADPRYLYLAEFIDLFNFYNMGYDKWDFFIIPETGSGFYDLHNSFLTIIVRDGYLGLFKVSMWAIQIILLPLGLFLGVTLRAFNDTFFLGGALDPLVFALIGNSVHKFFLKFPRFMFRNATV